MCVKLLIPSPVMTPYRRDPSAFTNGKKKEKATEDLTSEPDNGKPKATRNILLIRHSQYNLSGNGDKERILTPLGYFIKFLLLLVLYLSPCFKLADLPPFRS